MAIDFIYATPYCSTGAPIIGPVELQIFQGTYAAEAVRVNQRRALHGVRFAIFSGDRILLVDRQLKPHRTMYANEAYVIEYFLPPEIDADHDDL